MAHLDSAYEELQQLAQDRRTKLDESRRLWQFYWDMADEEGWIKEKEQLMSSPDLGHDLTSVNLLLSKHKVGTTRWRQDRCPSYGFVLGYLYGLVQQCGNSSVLAVVLPQ